MGLTQLKVKKERGYENLFAMFVGVEKFQDAHISHLFGSVEDAAELEKVFTSNEDLRSSNQLENIQLLVNEQATRITILDYLTQYINQAKSGDLLLFYLSTHGLVDYSDYYFFPHDCKLSNILGTGISATTIINAVSIPAQAGVKVLVILDTCHSGAIGFDLSKYKGEFSCLLSSSPVEFSYETFEMERSIFSYHLTEGIRELVIKNGSVSLVQLFNYVYKKVQEQTHKKQNPLLIGTMKSETILLI